jgi:hypothetical protein
MTLDLQTLADRIAIEEHTLMYAHLLDAGRFDQVGAAIFTEDAILELGEMVIEGSAAIQDTLGGFRDVLVGCSHNVTNLIIRVDGDTARTSFRILAWHWFKQADGNLLAANDLLAVGGYEDQLRRTADGWRVCHRRSFAQGTGIGIGTPSGEMLPLCESLSRSKIRWP